MAKAAARAIRDFPVQGDPWRVVDGWAQKQGFRVISANETHRAYAKGHGLMVATRKVEITIDHTGHLHLEAWVFSNIVGRVMSLFILPAEITVETGGVKAIVPRKMGRVEVNDLLAGFGQPEIP